MKKYLTKIRGQSSRDHFDERGMALLLTLLVTVILTVVVLEFNYLMRVHATLSGNLLDDLKAEIAARNGVERAKAILLNDLLADSKEGISLDSMEDEWASEIKISSQTSEADMVISDEMSKFNLNRLMNRAVAEAESETINMYMVENVRRLFELVDIDPNLVYGIVDWIDEDSEEEPFGAEDPHYASLEPPIRCKNSALDSLEELLFIEGFSVEILYGEDDVPGLSEFLTICGDESGLININTAPEEVIAAALNSESLASLVVETRNASPFEDLDDMTTRLPDVNFAGKFTTQSSFFYVVSTGRVLSGDIAGREVKFKTVLKRTREQDDSGKKYFSIDTVSWKMER
jgi:general secretion pathway protein K